MTCYVLWLVALLLMVLMERASGQGVQYSDQQAGDKIDILTPRGVGLAIKWHDQFWPQLMAVKDILDSAEDLLVNEFQTSARVNLTAMVQDKVAGLHSIIDDIIAMSSNDTGDDLIAYMRGPAATMNIGGHYSNINNKFTAPKAGLYKILIRNLPTWYFSCTVTKNGNDTLTTLENTQGEYDVRTRVRLVWLAQNDEVYTTGSTPPYFLILRLRVQTLMPDSLNN